MRTTLHEGYGGGFASFEALTLLRMDGETLVPILDLPVGVVVHPRTNTLADLRLKSRRTRHALPFRWSEQQGAYACDR